MGCIPVLERGCFGCCKLSTCVKALAVFNIVASVTNITMYASYLYSLDSLPDGLNRTQSIEKTIADNKILIGSYIIVTCLYLIIEILLLRGAQTGNRALLLPHLIGSSVLVTAIVCYSIDDFTHASDVGPVMFRLVCTAAVQLYFLLNVYSLYVQLGTPRETDYYTNMDGTKEPASSFA